MLEPLAFRMRPKTLEEFVGQSHLLKKEGILTRALLGQPTSFILWGPPGTGKTSLAFLIGKATNRQTIQINAVTTGIAELKKLLSNSQNPILFVDEIHRWNKAQQDFLLPLVESGKVMLIGSTTENPYFEVIGPLLSRVRVLRLEQLSDDEIRIIVKRALKDSDGLGKIKVILPDDVLDFIIAISAGDARSALNLLEDLVSVTDPEEGFIKLKIPNQETLRRLPYDKTGDEHYQVISAFIKSIRGSDIDATIYWLSRMVASGEDIRFIARRLVILAAEDIGLADPWALLIATSGFTGVEQVGLPEAGLILSEVAIYLAQAPKSNSTAKALWSANEVVSKNTPPVPLHLRNASFRGAKAMGYGVDYKYPHNFKGGYVLQQYLPFGLEDLKFFEPTDIGYEKRIKERIKSRKPKEEDL